MMIMIMIMIMIIIMIMITGSMKASWNCGEMSQAEPGLDQAPVCRRGSRIIYAWGMDAPALKLPQDVGFRLKI